jgi:hypothetical protein
MNEPSDHLFFGRLFTFLTFRKASPRRGQGKAERRVGKTEKGQKGKVARGQEGKRARGQGGPLKGNYLGVLSEL